MMIRILKFTVLLLFSLHPLHSKPINVACVGDSITWGARVEERQKNCYPAQLQILLGKNYKVQNFGCNGATLLNAGNKPYVKQGPYQRALASKPDIIVIKLGTNDSKASNWQYSTEFIADYKSLLTDFKKLESKPRIWICLPVRSFRDLSKCPIGKRSTEISQTNIQEAIPMIEAVAKDMNLELINLHSLLTDEKLYNSDQIHPNKEGAKLIAQKISETLQATQKLKSK